MNFQPLIDNLPYILGGLSLLTWAIAKLIEAYAKRNPVIDKWDLRAEQAHMVADKVAQGVEWLVASGFAKWTGAQKLEEVNKRVKSFMDLWDKGDYIEALSQLSGFYQSAMSKIQKAQGTLLPFVPRPSIDTNPGVSASSPEVEGISPDSPAVEG